MRSRDPYVPSITLYTTQWSLVAHTRGSDPTKKHPGKRQQRPTGLKLYGDKR